MLKNEVPFTWGLTVAMAWGICWRAALIGFVPAYFLSKLSLSNVPAVVLSAALGQVFVALVGTAIAVKWLFGSGRLGRLKILFMEQAHYQELASNPALNTDAVRSQRAS